MPCLPGIWIHLAGLRIDDMPELRREGHCICKSTDHQRKGKPRLENFQIMYLKSGSAFSHRKDLQPSLVLS
jgi:hypothetical protein